MSRSESEPRDINAKIVFFGPTGSGMSENLRFIHRKLRTEHRGEITSQLGTHDPASAYEVLPVNLGIVQGYRTTMDIYSVPGGDAFRSVRRQILDRADGVVFVADVRPDRHAATLEAAEELRQHLQSYARSVRDLILLTQYNHKDEADEKALERLSKQLDLESAASFEATAIEGTGVLQTLTTASKLIVADLRHKAEAEKLIQAAEDSDLEAAIDSALPDACLSIEGKGYRIEAAGHAVCTEGGVRVPIRLIDEVQGRGLELSVSVTIKQA